MNLTSTSNGYMDIHSITVEAGEDFENWIKISKQQLRERENKLMTLRICALRNIIKTQCIHFRNVNSSKCANRVTIIVANYDKVICDSLINECLDRLNELLSLWNGINLRKTKKAPTTLQKYFATAKCWFDQKKKCILAPDLWIKCFTHLEEFVADAASHCFSNIFATNHRIQKLYRKQLLFQILSGIFAGELQYVGTKAQPLIASTIIKDNHAMKHYLSTLHHTLNIDQLMRKNSSHSLNAKQLLAALNTQLLVLADEYQSEFHCALNDVYQSNINRNKNTNNTPNIQQIATPAIQLQSVHCDSLSVPSRNSHSAPIKPHNTGMQSPDYSNMANCCCVPQTHSVQMYMNQPQAADDECCSDYRPLAQRPQMPIIERESLGTVQYSDVVHDDHYVPQSLGPREPFEPLEAWESLDLLSPEPLLPLNMMDEMDVYGPISSYGANHSMSQSVISQRFTPMHNPTTRHNTHSYSDWNYI